MLTYASFLDFGPCLGQLIHIEQPTFTEHLVRARSPGRSTFINSLNHDNPVLIL